METKKWRKYFPKNRLMNSEVNDHTVLCEGLNLVHDYYKENNIIPQNILDIGCGDGYALDMFKKYYPKAKTVGITINPFESSLSEVRFKNTQGRDVLLMDMHEMDFFDKTFDTIYCRDVLEHSISPIVALYEMNRVLGMNNYAFIIIPDERDIEFDGHIYILNDRQMRHIIDKTGFKVKLFSEINYPRLSLGQFRYVLQKTKEPEYNDRGY